VWSDDAYADLDNDGAPESPSAVSLTAGPTLILFDALTAAALPWPGRIRLRNVKRPFADLVYRHLTRTAACIAAKADIPVCLLSLNCDTST